MTPGTSAFSSPDGSHGFSTDHLLSGTCAIAAPHDDYNGSCQYIHTIHESLFSVQLHVYIRVVKQIH